MAAMKLRWTRGSILTFALTSLASAALLALLFSRLLAAQQHVSSSGPASPLEGRQAPDFTVTVYNGTPGQAVHLADLKGHPVVVNFWASWCDPCRAEAPNFEAAWKKYQHDGVVFIGINSQDKPDAAQAFLQQEGITYLTGPDTANGDIAIAYGVLGLPETAFIDRSGKVVKKVGGAVDDGTLDRTIQQLLKG